jgi:hypothetical protein
MELFLAGLRSWDSEIRQKLMGQAIAQSVLIGSRLRGHVTEAGYVG